MLPSEEARPAGKEAGAKASDPKREAAGRVDRTPAPPQRNSEIDLKVLAEGMGLEFIEDLRPENIDEDVLQLIPESTARRHMLIAVRQTGEELVVATCDPSSLYVTDELPSELGISQTVVVAVAARQDILACIDATYSSPDDALAEIANANKNAPKVEVRAKEIVLREGDSGLSGAVLVMHSLLLRALKKHASDLSIEPGEGEMVVRIMVDGQWRVLEPPPDLGWHKSLVSAIKVAADMDSADKRHPADGRLTVSFGDHRYDVRVATMPVEWDEMVTLRVLDPKDAQRSFEEIGDGPSIIQLVERQICLPNGVILVTGPTGSGKTSTLYACLNRLNNDRTKIVTAEDPVEYHRRGINQSCINESIGYGFAQALKAMLRQNPDVILIGEMRDLETASIAMKAALSGHLVFSTLHTNDAVSSVTRLVEMGIPSYIVADAVRSTIAQRLVRKPCRHCAKEPEDVSSWAEMLGIPEDADLSNLRSPGKGCGSCHEGYRGRIAICEVLVIGEKIRKAIVAGEPSSVIRELAREAGMVTMQQDGCQKALQGITSLEEVHRLTACNL